MAETLMAEEEPTVSKVNFSIDPPREFVDVGIFIIRLCLGFLFDKFRQITTIGFQFQILIMDNVQTASKNFVS